MDRVSGQGLAILADEGVYDMSNANLANVIMVASATSNVESVVFNLNRTVPSGATSSWTGIDNSENLYTTESQNPQSPGVAYTLGDGKYEVTITPFAADGGAGASGPPLTMTFKLEY